VKEWGKFGLLVVVFVGAILLPDEVDLGIPAIGAGLALLHEYSSLHVLTCLVPAFFIAGTIAVFVKKDALVRLLGPRTPKLVAYPIAGISGGVLAVCSCTILPLFTGIYKRGAGIGPAVVFLFTGPAVNITAIMLTGSVLGWDFAFVRLGSAFTISVLSGLLMAFLFRSHDEEPSQGEFGAGPSTDLPYSNLLVTGLLLLQLGVLITFELSIPLSAKLGLVSMFVVGIVGIFFLRVERDDAVEWIRQTWGLVKKIVPFLLVGVFLAGALGSLVPEEIVTRLVGSNSVQSNTVASVLGAFMYFATLTEVPIVQRLLELGMAKGPALTLFLTGNSLSIPSMLVLLAVMGRREAATYILSIVALSVVAGLIFGASVG